ncbi:MAG: hypothetical protein GTO14_00605 [Anaerolineales bacterium]|nr:hypothetical protein [Anaerolineales bacterium]
MTKAEKITIVEGPPPTFEMVSDPWLHSLTEGPLPSRVAVCHVRALNGPALMERCYRAWHSGRPIYLEYRSGEGLREEAPIVAARWIEQSEGDVLFLWVRLEEEDIEIEIQLDVDDFHIDDFDEDSEGPDLTFPF